MCDECIRLFEENMNPLTHGVIEKYRARLVMVLQAINDAANGELHDEEIPREIEGILFAPFVAGYLAGEFATCEEQGESMMDLFESGLAYGILRRQAAESRKVH